MNRPWEWSLIGISWVWFFLDNQLLGWDRDPVRAQHSVKNNLKKHTSGASLRLPYHASIPLPARATTDTSLFGAKYFWPAGGAQPRNTTQYRCCPIILGHVWLTPIIIGHEFRVQFSSFCFWMRDIDLLKWGPPERTWCTPIVACRNIKISWYSY